jgi:hypothetical protein
MNKQENDFNDSIDSSNNNVNDSTKINLLIQKNISEIKGNYLVLHKFKIMYTLLLILIFNIFECIKRQ